MSGAVNVVFFLTTFVVFAVFCVALSVSSFLSSSNFSMFSFSTLNFDSSAFGFSF